MLNALFTKLNWKRTKLILIRIINWDEKKQEECLRYGTHKQAWLRIIMLRVNHGDDNHHHRTSCERIIVPMFLICARWICISMLRSLYVYMDIHKWLTAFFSQCLFRSIRFTVAAIIVEMFSLPSPSYTFARHTHTHTHCAELAFSIFVFILQAAQRWVILLEAVILIYMCRVYSNFICQNDRQT